MMQYLTKLKKEKLAVIILTLNEELHIERCLNSLENLPCDIYVVDSFSTDNTEIICNRFNVKFFKRKYLSYSDQFNWILNIIKENYTWCLKIDADEYLSENAKLDIDKFLNNLFHIYDGAAFNRRFIFLDKELKFGGLAFLKSTRLFKINNAYIENRMMDEHIVINGKTKLFNSKIYDHNIKNIDQWLLKHIDYSNREIKDYTSSEEIGLFDNKLILSNKIKRVLKYKIYYKIPFCIGPTLYFLYRYLILFGFLDGKQGFVFHFLQCYWYRLIVDIKKLNLNK